MSRIVATLIGRVFERLTVLAASDDERNGAKRWLCRCSCGDQCVVRGANLTSGATRSCGCLRSEATRERTLARNRERQARLTAAAAEAKEAA